MDVRLLQADDIGPDFLETLSALRDVGLTAAEALDIYLHRLNARTAPHVYVAVDGGRVVGSATLLTEQKFIHRGALAAHVEDVVVHPDYRGRGVGTALVREISDKAEQMGCYRTTLDCSPELCSFYNSLGFAPWATALRR